MFAVDALFACPPDRQKAHQLQKIFQVEAVTLNDDQSSQKETRDENYEKYVLETIIDSASHALTKDFRDALAKAAEAYDSLDTWENCSKNRSQSMNQVKAFVDLQNQS